MRALTSAAGLAVAMTLRLAAAPQVVQPGAPGEPSRQVSADAATAAIAPSPADVQFMQTMIAHHAQALEMTALARARTADDAFLSMIARIDTSQRDEIRTMNEWLRANGAPASDPHAHHGADPPLMPGMLTPAEMGRLAAARGAEFERLFLELMIKHHLGALVMVKELFGRPGGGSAPDVFSFAADVDGDQRMEIDRLRAMLARR
ncbi:MAG: DUF305 domain-containing protein [Acidobacteria bacterium]|nr:DUF305 domain-containing protein [Acidobacteriota bacterium]